MADLLGLRVAGAVDSKTGGGASAASQATVDAGTNTTEFVNPATLASASTVSRVANIFINGAFDVWQRTTNDTTVTSTAVKYVSDRWWVITGAGTLANVQRSTTVRTGALSKYSLEMVGATGVTLVQMAQRIESMYSARYKRTVAFSCYIFNGSGAAFTPKIYALTPNSQDVWLTSAIQNGGGSGENLQSCTDNAWTQVTWSADTSGYSNIGNGFGIMIEIPSGSLVASDTVRFAEMNLVPGSAFNPIEMSDPVIEIKRCERYYEKSYVAGVTPGTSTTTGVARATTRQAVAASTAGTVQERSYEFRVEKRTTPTVVVYSYDGTVNAIFNNSTSVNRTGATVLASARVIDYLALDNTSANAISLDNILLFHYTASAEL